MRAYGANYKNVWVRTKVPHNLKYGANSIVRVAVDLYIVTLNAAFVFTLKIVVIAVLVFWSKHLYDRLCSSKQIETMLLYFLTKMFYFNEK